MTKSKVLLNPVKSFIGVSYLSSYFVSGCTISPFLKYKFMDNNEYFDLEKEIEDEYSAAAKGCGILGCFCFILIGFIISIIILIF